MFDGKSGAFKGTGFFIKNKCKIIAQIFGELNRADYICTNKQSLKHLIMKSSTLSKRIEKIYTGAKSKMSYKIVCSVIDQNSNFQFDPSTQTVRPCYTVGSGRHTSTADHGQEIEQLLSKLGVKFEVGNDAPRGGKLGCFIKIKTKIVKG